MTAPGVEVPELSPVGANGEAMVFCGGDRGDKTPYAPAVAEAAHFNLAPDVDW